MNARSGDPALTKAAAHTRTVESVRELGRVQAGEWLTNANGLRDTGTLNGWRDGRRDDLRDSLPDDDQRDALMDAWAHAFDGAVDGLKPLTLGEIDQGLDDAHYELMAVAALLRSLKQLTKSNDLQLLCGHGATQAELVANELDILRDRAAGAGLAEGGAA